MATTTTIKTEPKLPPVFAGRGQTNLAEHSTQRWYHVADVPYARLLEADYWGKFFAREMNLHDELMPTMPRAPMAPACSWLASMRGAIK
jgi:hypothetical protein